eukprot:GCRY01005690.1.p1 GENE.GCRY01005690.1~~GCRY01005690.1.p1  ORF type:complete len:237 (-),score=60.16 GCRY01005690.1:19-729(-)
MVENVRVVQEELGKQCATFNDELTQWVQKTTESLHKLKEKQANFQSETMGAISSLKKEIDQLEKQGIDLESDFTLRSASQMRFEAEKKLLQEKLKEIEAFRGQLEHQIDEEQNQLAQNAIEMEETQNCEEEKLTEIKRLASLYEDRLGLKFERTEKDRLRFVFKFIDPEDFQKEFWFSIYVNGDDIYEMEECEPHLPRSAVQSLLTALNETNDFSNFVFRMRVMFVDLVQHPAYRN